MKLKDKLLDIDVKKVLVESNVRELNKTNYKDVFKELVELRLTGKIYSNNVFRGVNFLEQLCPALFRNFIGVAEDEAFLFDQLKAYELELLKNYERYSIQFLPYYAYEADWLASAQHYGIPTRLSDWTYDPFVALYFAINNKSPKDAYLLHTSFASIDKAVELLTDAKDPVLFDNNLYLENIPSALVTGLERERTHIKRIYDLNHLFDDLDKATSEQYRYITKTENRFSQPCKFLIAANKSNIAFKKSSLIFIGTNDANARIIAQSGLFQLTTFPSDKANSVTDLRDYLVETTIQQTKEVFIIKSEDKEFLLNELKNLNVYAPRLFPDLQNICDYIKKNTRLPGW